MVVQELLMIIQIIIIMGHKRWEETVEKDGETSDVARKEGSQIHS